jgi:hypothetical protein
MEITIDPNEFDSFVITYREYRRNTVKRMTTKSIRHAFGINLWNGRVWGIRPNGSRKLLKTVIN